MNLRIESRLAYLFFLPTIILIAAILFYPLFTGILLSTRDKYLLEPRSNFVGFANFIELFHDPVFWQALWNSFVWTTVSIFGQFVCGLGIALLLNLKFCGRQIFRAILLLPWVMPTIVIGIIWSWMFNDVYGFINYFLLKFGIVQKPVLFLADPRIALFSVSLPWIWRSFPFVMLVFLASLQGIDRSLYEAAEMDGAGTMKRFRYITLPSLKPTVLVVILLESIWTFNNFDIVYILTRGGPANATELLSTYSYRVAFEGFRASYGAATATIQFLILIVFSVLYLKFYNIEK